MTTRFDFKFKLLLTVYTWIGCFLLFLTIVAEEIALQSSLPPIPGFCVTECMQLRDCPILLNIYKNHSHEIEIDTEELVCCPQQLSDYQNSAGQLLSQSCYKELLNENGPPPLPIYGGRVSKANEFPYLALLNTVNINGSHSFPCAGTLISDRFILTAAHCVTGEILSKRGKLQKIRLGERDLSKIVTENGVYSGGSGNCSDNGAIEFEIGETIIHPDYHEKSKQNDIALVRILEPIGKYNLVICPACLIWECETKETKIAVGHNFTAVGWGRTLTAKKTSVSNTIEVPFYDHRECVRKYSHLKINITDNQICAGGEFKKDTCDGDSGGPLISKVNGCDFIDGIVSFGKGCGLENWPGIYTNVSSYKDWIMEHVQPYKPLRHKCLHL